MPLEPEMQQPGPTDTCDDDGFDADVSAEDDSQSADDDAVESGEGFDADDASDVDVAAAASADDAWRSSDADTDVDTDIDTSVEALHGSPWRAVESAVADSLAVGNSDAFVARMREALSGAPGADAEGTVALLARAWGAGLDDFEAFDQLVDDYEAGADAALPALVAMAARGLVHGLGPRSVVRWGTRERRALVRGVAAAARTLVARHGAQGARALGHLVRRAGEAARGQASGPLQDARAVAQALPRVAQRIARRPGVVQGLSRPVATFSSFRSASAAPGGTAGPGHRKEGRYGRRECDARTSDAVEGHGDVRVLRLRGPVDIWIRQR